MKKKLICITGPTASGKTALAIKLAKHFDTEIVSADSRQFYKEMKIGTAVPSEEELKAAPHHFIQHKSIFDEYSVGTFETDFLSLSERLYTQKNIMLLVGGSGLFIDAATKGLDKLPGKDIYLRQTLEKSLKEKGIEILQKELQELDPDFYNEIDIKNPHRLIRAIEILTQAKGKSMKELRNSPRQDRGFEVIYIGLNTERIHLYDRINKRVDIMMEQGLLEEAETLYKHRALNPLNTVGYKELFSYMDGEISLDFAISEIKKNTRRFAKRQLTWFRKNKDLQWFDVDAPPDNVLLFLDKKLK